MRLGQGVLIDRWGPRPLWVFSLLVVTFSLLAHLTIASTSPPWIYIARLSYQCGLAGAFCASITFISLRAPVVRMAEMIGMGTFFAVYTGTAFLVRLSTRRLPDRIGHGRTCLYGMASVVLSLFAYLMVQSDWHLILPGFLAGTGHALLFPSVVAGGSNCFPSRYRGLGVTIMLATFDLGNLLGMPLAGWIVVRAGRSGLPAYPTMFIAVAAILTSACVAFVLMERHPGENGVRRRSRLQTDEEASLPVGQTDYVSDR